MADPLSISAGVVGIAGFALGSVRETISLIQGVLGAPSAVRTLKGELNTLDHILQSLNDVVNDESLRGQDQHRGFFTLLEIPLQQCVLTTHGIRERLKPYIRADGAAKTATWKGLSWFLHEKEFLGLKQNLASQRSALEIAVSVVNLSSVGDVKREIISLRKNLAVDNDSTGDPDFEGSSIQGSDHGYAIKRFLLDTESLIIEDVPEPDLLSHPELWVLKGRPQPSALAPVSGQPLYLFSHEQDPVAKIVDANPVTEDDRTGRNRNKDNAELQETSGSAQLAKVPMTEGKDTKSTTVWKETLMSTSYRKVFGVSLMDSYQTYGDLVPAFVRRCIKVLDMYGLEVNMIYSLTGKIRTIERIKSVFDQEGAEAAWPVDTRSNSALHSIAASLKRYLRELPEALVPSEHYDALIVAAKTEEHFNRLVAIQKVIRRLDHVHFTTLKAIMLHLRRVADHSSVNSMNSKNIAMSSGATFLRSTSPTGNLDHTLWHLVITEMLTEYAHEIFEDND